jgi:hypothetical protein
MKLDKRVIKTCQDCAMKHIEDIEKACLEARKRLNVPTLPGWISSLVDNALREQIHWARQISNKKLRKAAGVYGGPGKVNATEALSNLAEQVWQDSLFNHTISGWLLGEIEQDEFLQFAEVEDEKSAGAMFNAALCRACYDICVKRKANTIRECMTEPELAKLFKRVAGQLGRDAA